MTPQSSGPLLDCFGCRRCSYKSRMFKAICPRCGSAEILPLEPASSGELLDFVPVLYPPENLKHLGQYVSILVELHNGCHTFGIFLGDPATLRIGSTLVASSHGDDTSVPLFRPLGSGGSD